MPTRPRRPCTYPNCRELVESGRCDEHRNDGKRASASERGYDWDWRRARKAFLRTNPLCYYCDRVGDVTAATCVDHATPHSRAPELFWEPSNWRAACRQCNEQKGNKTEAEYLLSRGLV